MNGSFRYILLIFLILSFFLPGSVTGSGADLIFVDLGAGTDSSSPSFVPFTNSPSGLLELTSTIRNAGDTPSPQYYISYYLKGEDISSFPGILIGQIGGLQLLAGEEVTNTDLLPVPMNIRSGKYHIVGIINPLIESSEPVTDNNRIETKDSVTLGVVDDDLKAIPITGPIVIKESGAYEVTEDFTCGKMYAIEIQSSGVTIEGAGHTITGVNNRASCGVYVNGKNPLQDITIKNLNINQFGDGIWLYETRESTITGCSVNQNDDAGIRLDKSLNNSITGNRITGNKQGIGVFQSQSNIFYNNYLANQYNVIIPEKQTNFWNTTKQSGQSITGGSVIGGNAWDNPDGTGFSTTVPDYNNDGIGDAPYAINADNIDYYPLTFKPVMKQAQSIPLEQNEQQSDQPVMIITTPMSVNVTEPEPPVDSGLLVSDIYAVHVSAEDKGIPGSALPVTGELQNLGTKVTDEFKVYFYLSKDKLNDENDYFGGVAVIPPLSAGEEYTVSQMVDVPSDILNGLYYVVMFADATLALSESNEKNNKAITDQVKIQEFGIEDYILKRGEFAEIENVSEDKIPEIIEEPSGLQEVPGPESIPALSNETEEMPKTSNTVPEIIEEPSGLQKGPGPESIPALTNETEEIPLFSNEISFFVMPPSEKDLINQNEEISQQIMKEESPIPVITGIQKEEEAEQSSTAGTYLVAPDIVTTGVRVETTGIVGESIVVKGSVQNNGYQATDSYRAAFYLSDDTSLDGNDSIIGTSVSRPLCSGCHSTYSFSGFIPEDVDPGSYYVIVLADSDQKLFETDENNNTDYINAPIAVYVKEISPNIRDPVYQDLYANRNASQEKVIEEEQSVPFVSASIGGIPSEIVNKAVQLSVQAAPMKIHSGDSVSLSGLITNTKLEQQTVWVTYYLSTDTEMSPEDIELGSAHHFFYNPGDTASITLDSAIPSVPSGYYHIIAVLTTEDLNGGKKDYAVAATEKMDIFGN